MADSSSEEPISIQALVDQVVLARAADLARAGRYAEAEALLQQELRDRKATPAILDLLARIHAQQGHWREAEAAWTQALQLRPANEMYTAGLRRISQVRQRPMAFLWKPVIVSIAAALIFLGGLVSGRFVFFPLHPEAGGTSPEVSFSSLTQTPPPLPTLTRTPSPLPPQVISPTPTLLTCRVTTGLRNGMLHVRRGPGIDYPVVDWLSEGEQVVILTPDGGWMFIVQEPDLEGWVNSSYCK